jgi:hypothetical protein
MAPAGLAEGEKYIMTYAIRHWHVATLLSGVLLSAVGCGSGDSRVVSDAVASGELQLPLVTASQGSFRLRSAVFQLASVSGSIVTRLDSEAEPDSTSLRAELPQDAYTATLEEGWALERLSEQAGAVSVRAALLSQNPATFEIRDGRLTRLVYEFATDDGVVVFGAGAAEVAVSVTEAPSASCSVLDAASCPGGQTCLLADASGQTFCAEPGTLPVGSLCSTEQCVPGAQCLKLNPEQPDQGVCARFCSGDVLEFGCECRSLSFDDGIGVCTPPPFPICEPLTQTGCNESETCQHRSGSFAVCGPPGAGQLGESCLGETCARGLDCHGDQAELGIVGTCTRFCDTRTTYQCPFASPYYYYQYCQDVGTGNVGRCL